MRGLTRLLFMFGPMIYRQYNKYMSSRQNQQRTNDTVTQQDEMHPHNEPKQPDVKDEDLV